MAEKKFSIKEAISFGWEIVKANLGFFVAFLVVGAIIQYVPAWLANSLQKNSKALALIFRLISWLLQMVVSMGFVKIGLKFHDGGKGEWSDMYQCYPLLLNYVAASLLYGVIVFVGILLFIVPGIIWAIKYQFFGYLIVDKNLGPIEAIKQSGQMSKGSIWDLFLFGLTVTGVTLMGALCFLLGLFVAIPVVLMAGTFIYRKLSS